MGTYIVKDFIHKDSQHLPIIRSEDSDAFEELLHYFKEEKEIVEGWLLKAGGILFRGFNIKSQEIFLQIKEGWAGTSHFSYKDGNSPRTKLTADIYTSTEYPKEFPITLHNELCYSAHWPLQIFFCCLKPASEGGSTPVIDSRYLLSQLGHDIIEPFEEYGVCYTRYLTGTHGVGKTWMQTFETSDPLVVEAICKQYNMEFSWEGSNLHLKQWGQGVAKHPKTGESVWFNQANQFHPSSLPPDIYKMLQKIHANKKHHFPHYAYYGNGKEIPEKVLSRITEVQFDSALQFSWEEGDLLLLDNMLMAHGRMPFKGERKVLVSMC